DDRVGTTTVDYRGHDDPQREDHGRRVVFAMNDSSRSGHDDPLGDDHGRHGHRHHDGLRAANAGREAEPGDDRGAVREAEPNDEHGASHRAEPGDDHGGSHEVESLDDSGRHDGGHEPGDDHGGR